MNLTQSAQNSQNYRLCPFWLEFSRSNKLPFFFRNTRTPVPVSFINNTAFRAFLVQTECCTHCLLIHFKVSLQWFSGIRLEIISLEKSRAWITKTSTRLCRSNVKCVKFTLPAQIPHLLRLTVQYLMSVHAASHPTLIFKPGGEVCSNKLDKHKF